MAGYTKLFGSIVFSTIWREELHVKVVWVTLLALADQWGEVATSVPGLADAARVTIEQCEDALAKFMSPDPYSRTADFEGRRIRKIEGGYLILNYGKYRDEASKEHKARKNSDRQKRHRDKLKAAERNGESVTNPLPRNAFVTENNSKAEAEADSTYHGGKVREENLGKGQVHPDWDTDPFGDAGAA